MYLIGGRAIILDHHGAVEVFLILLICNRGHNLQERRLSSLVCLIFIFFEDVLEMLEKLMFSRLIRGGGILLKLG